MTSIKKIFMISEEVFYHGSPFGGIESFDDIKLPAFFTKDKNIAKQYATAKILGAQNDPLTGKEKTKTIYTVDLDPGKILDFRTKETKDLYRQIRTKELAGLSLDAEERLLYPKLESEGFIMSNSGLPGYGHVRSLADLFKKHGHDYDSMLVDEGTQGISLALLKKNKTIKIVKIETID